jgi:hypothetical protein
MPPSLGPVSASGAAVWAKAGAALAMKPTQESAISPGMAAPAVARREALSRSEMVVPPSFGTGLWPWGICY